MYKLIIFLTLTLFTFSSCFKERINPNYNTGENKKLVITGWINSLPEPQFINISRTVNYLGGLETDKVSGAAVILEDAIGSYTLEEKGPGTYYLPEDWVARVGDLYQLEVRHLGETYTSSHVMRPCPEIENPDFQVPDFSGEEVEFEEDPFETVFGFQELPGEEDAYYGMDYVKGSYTGIDITKGGFADDAFVDGQYFDGVVLTDENYFVEGDTAVIEFHSIGLETANFLQDIELEIYRGSPFDPPPANVRTNITGGAIGYFVVSDARRAEVVIE